jgi:hypothetical protein
VRYRDPSGLAVELWRGNDTLSTTPCTDAADAAREAERLFNECCQPLGLVR